MSKIANADKVFVAALKEDAVEDYLLNRNNYKKPVDKYSDNDEPDCSSLLFGIHWAYRDTKDKACIDSFVRTIKKWISGSQTEVRCAIIYFGLQMDMEKKGQAIFSVSDYDLLEYIKKALNSKKQEYVYSGLWSFIEEYNEVNLITNGTSII